MSTITVKVVSIEGKEVESLELDPQVFGAKVDKTLVHATVRWQLSKRRAGTHQALTRSMMKGGGKKPYKQKGTGRARAGSIISPLWVGGAVVHGPLPRSYEHRLPKRARRQALAAVLTDKVKEGQLIVVSGLDAVSGKTKDVSTMLGKLGVAQSSSLIVLPAAKQADGSDLSAKVIRGARNLSKATPMGSDGVNVYDLLRHNVVVCAKEAIEELEARVKGERAERDT